MDERIRLKIPAWAASLYIGASAALVPWTFYLNNTLHSHHVFRHWDVAWVGFDVALIALLLLTGVSAYKKSPYVIITAALTGGLLLMDVWFDVLSAHAGRELAQAVSAAIFLELPMAIASFRLAYTSLKKL